jgi:peptide/nickel transport system substrate-binding protein
MMKWCFTILKKFVGDMMKRKRITRLICALVAVFICLSSFSACGGSGDDTTETETAVDPGAVEINYNELKLPYSKADTLDPFKAKSAMNRQIAALMYDGLFSVDKKYEPVPQIAEKYTLDGTELTVTLSKGIVFTDGAYITSDDVAYSFERAKKSDAYGGRLSNFEKVIRADGETLVFTLYKNDVYAASCLDFPVVKYGTVQTEYKTLPEIKPPVGSGRYVFTDGPVPTLTVNNSRLGSFWPVISSIHLVNVSDSSALFYSLEIGNISFAFDDLSGGKYTRANADSAEYNMNKMVYLGFNAENASLGSPTVRRAIELAIDRLEIIETGFQGHATVSYSPFNPDWYASSDKDFTFNYGVKNAIALLEAAGYDKINTYKIRNDGSKSLTFKLIVNKDNEFKLVTAKLIAGCLAKLNIHVSISALSPEDFLQAYDALDFDMYIGEVNMTPNMSILPFFKGSLSKGVYSDAAEEAYRSFAAGELSITDYADAFREETPFMPLCFRKGVVAGMRKLVGATEAWAGDIYGNIEEWSFE